MEIINETAMVVAGLNLSRHAAKALGSILGPSLNEMGEILADRLRYWRAMNFKQIMEKTAQKIIDREIEGDPSYIPAGLAFRIIEEAAREDDEFIQEMWASLIANSVDPAAQGSPKKYFVRILSELEPDDAKVLQWFYNQGWNNEMSYLYQSHVVDALSISLEDASLSLNNLERLALIYADRTKPNPLATASSKQSELRKKDTSYKISSIGHELMEICTDKPGSKVE